MLRQKAVCLLILLLLLPTLGIAHQPSSEPVRPGSVAVDTPAVMYNRLRPLTEYLSQALQRPVSLKLSPDMPAAIQEVASGNVELDPKNPDHNRIIKALDKKYDGFAPTSDAEYDVVRQLIKPFQYPEVLQA